MIHLFFKTIWNNRKRNILVFFELFMISIVLVNLTVYIVNMISIYRIKNCYDSHNVIVIGLSSKKDEDKEITEQAFRNLKTIFASNPDVESVSMCTNAMPYNYMRISNVYSYDNNNFNLDMRKVDIDYAKVMRITPLKGRWFDETDIGKSEIPVLISKDIEDKYFGGNAIGKKLENDKKKHEIIGVVDHFKRSDIERPNSCGFFFENISDAAWWGLGILIRTKEGKTGEILSVAESQVFSALNPEFWAISNLNSLENMRDKQNTGSAQRHYMSLILVLFIMINVFLGVIGILWYNINLRIHEIGIKRALGATGNSIVRLLLSENIFLGASGLIMVFLIVIQAPSVLRIGKIEPEIFVRSVWISTAIMIFLIIICTLIPASIASKIRPASALKTE